MGGISNLDSKKRIVIMLFVVNVIWIILCIRVGIIQLVQGEKWKEKSHSQQYVSRSITAGRGTIYDCSGEIILAKSSTVETVTVNPGNIPKDKKEEYSKKLSELFNLEYEKILKKVSKRSSIETIVKRVEKDKTDELRKWIHENNILTGINIDEDTKRFYPNNNLAAQIIGFCGNEYGSRDLGIWNRIVINKHF